jgi:hypothetical protein
VPNNVNLQSELLWLCESLVVMANSASTFLIIAVLLNSASKVTYLWLEAVMDFHRNEIVEYQILC